MHAAIQARPLRLIGWAIALCLLWPGGRAAAEPIEARVGALQALIGATPQPEAVRRFVQQHYAAGALAARPAEARLPMLLRVLGDLRGGAVDAVRILGPASAELVARAPDGLEVRFELTLEAAPPHGIAGIGIQAGPATGPGPAPDATPLTEAEALRRIDVEVERRAQADRFSGVVLVARDGKPLYARAVGLAERGFGVANRIDTRFNLGSIDKIFTSVVIHQLAAEGRLRLDAPLETVLPDYPNRDVAAKVTLRQLLDHRSGLGDFFNQAYDEAPRHRLRSLADYLPLFVDRPLEFAPGSRQRYSNAGYIVLGLVIERLTAMSYHDAVKARVFDRAGMADTASWAVDDVVANRAVGYTQGREALRDPALPLRSNVARLPARGSSAGGGYSTAADLLRFATALAAGKLLPPGTDGPGAGIGIAGGSDGVNALLEIGAPGERTVVVLANLDPPAAEDLGRFVRRLLRGAR